MILFKWFITNELTKILRGINNKILMIIFTLRSQLLSPTSYDNSCTNMQICYNQLSVSFFVTKWLENQEMSQRTWSFDDNTQDSASSNENSMIDAWWRWLCPQYDLIQWHGCSCHSYKCKWQLAVLSVQKGTQIIFLMSLGLALVFRIQWHWWQWYESWNIM